jgi:putative tricarboxylic transport membrane protein
MSSFQSLIQGFSIALTPLNVLLAFSGAVVGTMVGVLPGIGPISPSP